MCCYQGEYNLQWSDQQLTGNKEPSSTAGEVVTGHLSERSPSHPNYSRLETAYLQHCLVLQAWVRSASPQPPTVLKSLDVALHFPKPSSYLHPQPHLRNWIKAGLIWISPLIKRQFQLSHVSMAVLKCYSRLPSWQHFLATCLLMHLKTT